MCTTAENVQYMKPVQFLNRFHILYISWDLNTNIELTQAIVGGVIS